MKLRLDKLLVQRGLAQSRERAQALILAGKVLVNEQKIDKPGVAVPSDASLRLLGNDLPYVSRGGLKLEAALRHWQIDVRHRCCLDVGASTGGFTDCLLQHGAARVIAIDTGYGQLDFRLRQDPRVHLLEKTNARYLKPEDLAVPSAIELPPLDVIVMDVSFISATLVLPAVLAAVACPEICYPAAIESREAASHLSTLTAPASRARALDVIVLVKPQFEAGREHVGEGGIVRNPEAQEAAVERVRQCLLGLGAASIEVTDSPILGMEGNREFLMYARFARVLPNDMGHGKPGCKPAPGHF